MVMEKLIRKLKAIIDQEGLNYLTSDPYRVYIMLLSSGIADKKICAALLHTLLMDIPSLYLNHTCDEDNAIEVIMKECCFDRETASMFADMYQELFSEENIQEWKRKDQSGLISFLRKELSVSWNGTGIWERDDVYVSCEYHADIILKAILSDFRDIGLMHMLRDNPFLDEEAISEYFRKSLISYLDKEFQEYCECDDYYPPVGEDFDAEGYVEEWCNDRGFSLVSFEGEGETGDYEALF